MANAEWKKKKAPSTLPAAPDHAPVPSRPPALLVIAVCAALVAAICIVYGGVLSCDFVSYDDGLYITENTTVQRGLTAKSVGWAFTTTAAANWHPVTWLSHMLDVQIFGAESGGHHATNLLLHILDAILLLLLLLEMTGALWRSALVAALFALHPLHVESVAWVSERKDVLSTLFWMLTLLAWLGFVRSKRPGWYALSLLLFSLGLMAKPMLVTLPFTLLLLDYWPLDRLALPPVPGRLRLGGLLAEKIPFFALSAASSVVTFIAQKAGGAVQTLRGISFPDRVANATWTYGEYLLKTVWPTKMAVFYPLPTSGHPVWQVALAALVLLIASGWVLRMRGRAPYLAFGWLWYLGTLVPVIGLVQAGSQMMADRYTYIPLIGIFVALSWWLGEAMGNRGTLRPVLAGVLCTWLAALAVVARFQVTYWADSTALFEHALAVTTENCVAHNNLGTVLAARGAYEPAMAHFAEALRIAPTFSDAHGNLAVALEKMGRRPEAVKHFDQATQFGSKSPTVWVNLGNALAAEGRLEDALADYEHALKLNPEFADALQNMGLTLDKLGRGEEAATCFIRAAELQPDFSEAHYQAGRTLAKMGKTDAAIGYYRRALSLKPNWTEAHNDLGAALASLGRFEEAIRQYGEVLSRCPDHADAHNNLGLALASVGRMAEARAQFELALRSRPEFADAHNNLGVAFAREGRLPEAMEQFREALRIQPQFSNAKENLQRMEAALGKGGPQP